MNIELVTRDVVVNDQLRDRLEKKLVKILERANKEIPVRVFVENARGRYGAQITMSFMGKDIVAQSDNKTMMAAIDDAVDKAERQFAKVTGKKQSRRTSPGAAEIV